MFRANLIVRWSRRCVTTATLVVVWGRTLHAIHHHRLISLHHGASSTQRHFCDRHRDIEIWVPTLARRSIVLTVCERSSMKRCRKRGYQGGKTATPTPWKANPKKRARQQDHEKKKNTCTRVWRRRGQPKSLAHTIILIDEHELGRPSAHHYHFANCAGPDFQNTRSPRP